MNKKKIISAMLTVAMLASSAVSALAAEVGESLKVGDYTESAAETQKLIDSASYGKSKQRCCCRKNGRLYIYFVALARH